MRRKFSWLVALLILVAMITIPLGYMTWRQGQQGNNQAGVAYRSGKMSASQLQEAVAAHNIRTVVSVQDD